jgi:hypothetical protein
MKRLITLLTLSLFANLAFGQACGIYRIKYIGSVVSTEYRVVKIHLPTTMYLHGLQKKNTKFAFIDTTLVEGTFQIEIGSHLTTPYNDTTQLLTFYKTQNKKFKLKVTYLDNQILKEKFLEIDWDNIKISIIKDNQFGTLFEFNLGILKL